MSGFVNSVAKVIKKVVPKALPIALQFIPGIGTAASIGLGALSSFAANSFMSKGKSALSEDPATLAAQRRQAVLFQQQQAVAARQRTEADKREAELDEQLASSRRAATARRRGRGGLAYAGPTTSLKTKLGE